VETLLPATLIHCLLEGLSGSRQRLLQSSSRIGAELLLETVEPLHGGHCAQRALDIPGGATLLEGPGDRLTGTFLTTQSGKHADRYEILDTSYRHGFVRSWDGPSGNSFCRRFLRARSAASLRPHAGRRGPILSGSALHE